MPSYYNRLARRIVDRRVLHLIKMWLECPVEETMIEEGRHARPKPGQPARHSAGLTHLTAAANIYMRGSCWDEEARTGAMLAVVS